MVIRECTIQDCSILALLNKELIEDEKHDNTMGIEQLEERMEGFLNGEYRALFFMQGDDIIGYALVKTVCSPPYLRQFYICRGHRRKGYGTEAFQHMMACLKTDAIDIEVLYGNARGIRFWESLGFRPRSIYLCYRK